MRLRAIAAAAVSAASAAAMLFTAGAAQGAVAQGAAAQYPPTVCSTVSVSTTHPLPGEAITVSGVNFKPNTSVSLELVPPRSVLATVTSDGQGSFSASVKLPDGVSGTHKILATTGALKNANCPSDPFVVVHIQSLGGTTAGLGGGGGGGGNHGGTSFTGVDVLLILIAAAVLIGIGAALNLGGKRRRAHTGHPLID